MRNFDVFFDDEKTAEVRIEPPIVRVNRLVIHPVMQIFAKDVLTMAEFEQVLRNRCWDEHRADIEKYLEKLGLKKFDPYKICEHTHGVMIENYTWFRFEGEDITSKDVLKWLEEKPQHVE